MANASAASPPTQQRKTGHNKQPEGGRLRHDGAFAEPHIKALLIRNGIQKESAPCILITRLVYQAPAKEPNRFEVIGRAGRKADRC